MFSDSEHESSVSAEDNVQLTINEHYAKAFNYRKEREEYEKCELPLLRSISFNRFSTLFFIRSWELILIQEWSPVKEKYGSDMDEEEGLSEESTDSESAESEDEDGEELTPAVDAAILRTLARIRKKDPAIYDSSKSIFGGEFPFL